MERKVIGILPTIKNSEENAYLNQYYFVKQYSKVIYECNALPIGLLLNEDKLDYNALSICDGFIYPGGSAIKATLYDIFKYAIQNHKPILGVCLGMQAMGIYSIMEEEIEKLGKNILSISKEEYRSIYDRLKSSNPMLLPVKDINKHNGFIKDFKEVDKALHKIYIAKDSLLYDVYQKEKIDVVSLHKMALTRVGSNFSVSARDDKGVIEGIESKRYNFIGVQYHPEALEDKELFTYALKLERK